MSRQVIIINDPESSSIGFWLGLIIFFIVLLNVTSSEPSAVPTDSQTPENPPATYERMDARDLNKLSNTGRHLVDLQICQVIAVDTLENGYRLLLKSSGEKPYNFFLADTNGPHPRKGEWTNVKGALIFEKNPDGSRGARLLNAQFE